MLQPALEPSARRWVAPTAHGPVIGSVSVPGSKSLTNRHLVLGLLAATSTTLRGPLVARDTLLMLDAVAALGAGVERLDDDAVWRVSPPPSPRGRTVLDCGLAGTVLRFLPPAATLADGPVHFDGDPRARQRPVTALLQALARLGARVETGGRLAVPFTVHGAGRLTGGQVHLDSSASSQFISGLLLSGARFDRGVRVTHRGAPLPSQPHLAMTVEVLRGAGVMVDDSTPGTWEVPPGPINGGTVRIEPDLSSAAPFLAAAAVSAGSVRLQGWPECSSQPGALLPAILTRMGCQVAVSGGTLTLSGPQPADLTGIDVDLRDAGELTPVLAAVAACAQTPSMLRGVTHLRGHETDRLAALESELGAVGAGVRQTADGLTVSPAPLHARRAWRTYGDHRMVMTGAVVGLRLPGLVVQDPQNVAKTYPGFVREWEGLLARE